MLEQEIEIWKDIVGYTGYKVSTLGRVKSLNRKPLKLVKSRGGYLCAVMCISGKNKQREVHRLVAKAFIPNPENKPQVNHIDGNKRNNAKSNLEWNTAKENMQHSVRIGLWKPKVGIEVWNAKFKDDDIFQIRNLYNSGEMDSIQLGLKYNTSPSHISGIINGSDWGHLKKGIDKSYKKAKGEKHFSTTLRDLDVINIKKIYVDGSLSAQSVCKMYNVHENTIYNIVNGLTWSHVGSDIDLKGKSFKQDKVKMDKIITTRVIKMYYEENKTQAEIGLYFNVHPITIFRAIKKYNKAA